MIEITTIPKERQALHACNRPAFCPRPGDLETIKRIGMERWIEQQLHPATIPEPATLVSQIGGLETLRMTPGDLFMRYRPPLRAGATPDPEARKTARENRYDYPSENVPRTRSIRPIGSA